METCLVCHRRIWLMKTGQFRKHVKEKGSLCPGSWTSPRRQLKELEQKLWAKSKEKSDQEARD